MTDYINEHNFKNLKWKSCVTAPNDATRPVCKVCYSYDGKTIDSIIEDETDLIDWLITIGYQTNE